MKLIIRPYPNYEVSDRALNEDILPISEKKSDSSGLSKKLIMITVSESGEKRLYKVRPVSFENNIYLTAFPNPIHVFLSSAIDHYELSEKIKSCFPEYSKKYGDDVYIMGFADNHTHECYNDYIKYRVSSIIMLVSGIEAFLNYIIPDNFIYKAQRKGKMVSYTKADIESTKISLNEKFIDILPLVSETQLDWNNLEIDKSQIIDLYDTRKKLIHLKASATDDLERYFDTIDKMLDLELLSVINSVIKIMNIACKGFIEFMVEK